MYRQYKKNKSKCGRKRIVLPSGEKDEQSMDTWMLLSIVREGLFHAICVHITEGFLKVKLINNSYQ